MGTLADECQRQGRLAATFIFSTSSGSPDRRSKQCFVATLAYQLQRGRVSKEQLGDKILSAVGADPVIFYKQLEEQMEVLILDPVRSSQGKCDASVIPNIIIIDGLDECDLVVGEISAAYGRTHEDEQIEILSILLQAVQDPSFPFKIIIASRPERWIRRFFSMPLAAAHTTEIFLDKEYSPDDDIALYLRSKFSEIRRRHDHLPPSWPGEENIRLLVANSSGQFIYAATVMRFIETPSKLPQVQLEIILNSRVQDTTNPFGPLDALYTKIILSCPLPDLTFLWLRAHQLMTTVWEPTGAFFNHICESHAGESQLVIGTLPSLVRYSNSAEGRHTFYHESFLDFLRDPTRCSAFCHLDTPTVLKWIGGRFSQILLRTHIFPSGK